MLNRLHLKQIEQRNERAKKGTSICRICKEEKQLNQFSKYNKPNSYSSRCEKCRYKQAGRKHYDNTKGTVNRKYDTYKTGAKQRNHKFDLTIEQFISFWNKPCSYCGKEIETIGLDRVDNSIGYSIDNCVSCCEVCNKMKRMMTVKEFIEQCEKVIDFHYCKS